MCAMKLLLPEKEKQALDLGFSEAFGGKPQYYFSAPGRTEIGGNHTDHQGGRVLAAAVDLDTRAAVARNADGRIRIQSRGYPLCEIDLNSLGPRKEEKNSTTALIRGVTAGFRGVGCAVEGFDAYCESTVLPGSGLSSSAAFEVLVETILNFLFFSEKMTAPEIARIGQMAENIYFGKPCGLMDQMASAVGNLVEMNFLNQDQPEIRPVSFDFSTCGHALCIIDTRASHADLTGDYAAIPEEMWKICHYFGKNLLSQVPEEAFYAALPRLRTECGDRAVLRAMHFFEENKRVVKQVSALESGDFETFLSLVRESGQSSWMYLQNVIPAGASWRQDMALALACCGHFLVDRGAFRVHGGGFAGTVQAFVPEDLLKSFQEGMDGIFGAGACHVLSIRPQGGVQVF